MHIHTPVVSGFPRPRHPGLLVVQLAVLAAAEIGLFALYGEPDASSHWATHLLVSLTTSFLMLLGGLLVTGAPRLRFLLLLILGMHLFAAVPDLLFLAGVPHSRWMDLFLGHIVVHYLPGGVSSWVAIAVGACALYVAVVALWIRARRVELDSGMPPGVGLTGSAVIRPQFDPRVVPMASEENGQFAGADVVLVHGLGASAAFWRPVSHELAKRRVPTLTPDLLGFGRSSRLGTHFHLDDQAAAIIRLVAARNRGPVLLVAHSYGAAVAVVVASKRPDLISSLVLVEPAVFSDVDEARQRIGRRNWLADQAMKGSPIADWACGAMCLFRQPLTALAPRVTRRYSPSITPDIARGAVAHVWPAYRDALASLLHANPLPQWLASPSKPTTVIVGTEDQTVVAADVAALLGPTVCLERFPGTHALPFEYPIPLASLITKRWNQLERPVK